MAAVFQSENWYSFDFAPDSRLQKFEFVFREEDQTVLKAIKEQIGLMRVEPSVQAYMGDDENCVIYICRCAWGKENAHDWRFTAADEESARFQAWEWFCKEILWITPHWKNMSNEKRFRYQEYFGMFLSKFKVGMEAVFTKDELTLACFGVKRRDLLNQTPVMLSYRDSVRDKLKSGV
jgi:hypothetical protein